MDIENMDYENSDDEEQESPDMLVPKSVKSK
jgi:hypothetical protein